MLVKSVLSPDNNSRGVMRNTFAAGELTACCKLQNAFSLIENTIFLRDDIKDSNVSYNTYNPREYAGPQFRLNLSFLASSINFCKGNLS